MASPLREKRTWPPREKDADSAESAAFEATVAVVKETVVRSGEVLVSAKEDLTDHKRWLEAQRAAVQADRARHERWLQKQQEKQEALDRRERAKRRRQLMRQNAMRAVENAAFAVLDSVLSLFWTCVGKIAAFFAYLRDSILRGFAWVGARLRDLAAHVTRLAKAGASAIAGKTRALAGSAGSALSAAGSSVAAKSGELARFTGSALTAASSLVAAKSAEMARSTGNALSAAGSSVAAKSAEIAEAAGLHSTAASSPAPAELADVGGDQAAVAPAEPIPAGTPYALAEAAPVALAEEPAAPLAEESAPVQPVEGAAVPTAGTAIAARLAPIFARVATTVRTSVETLARLIAALSAKAAPLARSSAERVSAGLSAISAKVRTASPQLHGAFRKGTETAGLYAKEAAARSGALLARIKPSPSAHENEVSSSPDALSSQAPARVGGYDLSQMLIISGVVLLVCGGLLVGSGLVLRAAGSGSGPLLGTAAVEKPPSPHAVAWFFEEPELPIVERSVFSAELTPHGVRLTGLAIKAENNSDDPLSGLEGVVKPDAKRLDLKLEVKVDMVPAEGTEGAAAAAVQGNGVIPPHAFFRLVFSFPPEAHGEEPGIALNDFIAAYGGLMLKLRYDVAGTQKSLIHYLSPEMLKAQLTEIQHEADGS
ncbi:MAG TPA: hypothetical protein VK193_12565 [Methyloceanibacter sp.]|nr:hypothetical protein [Methyloceanibacter sp.]